MAVELAPATWPCGDCTCDSNGIGQAKYMIPGILEGTRQCLRQMVTPYSWLLLDLHKHYMAGNLAIAGGITDQPAAYLDAMTIITEWRAHGSSSDS